MSNVLLNAGSGGATLGTDTVTGTPNVDYQIVKIGYSVAASAPTQVSASNPLPVAEYLSGTAASVNTGNADAGTQRVVLATNQPSIANAIPVTQSGAWTVSVNGVVADATAFTRGTTVQLPVGGVVEAAQSALTVGQTRALSLTTGALLRVDASGTTVPVSGTFWQATQPVSGTFWQATQPVSGTVTANQGTANSLANAWPTELTDGTNGPAAVKAASTAAVAADKALVVAVSPNNTLAATQSGTWNVTINTALPAGTNAIGQVNVSPVSGQGWPSTYSGSIGATATAVKSSAGTLGAYYIYNANTSVVYVQIFDLATGSVTLGTTAPKWSIGIPASGAANLELVNGLKFSTAITIAVTTTRAGSTAPTSTVDINMAYD